MLITPYRQAGSTLRNIEFCIYFLQKSGDEGFDDQFVFGIETTFYVSDKINKHYTRILNNKNPHVTLENVSDFPKVNIFFCYIQEMCLWDTLL